MRDDLELVRRYVLQHDNEAFAELVGGAIDFVYAAAWTLTALRLAGKNSVSIETRSRFYSRTDIPAVCKR